MNVEQRADKIAEKVESAAYEIMSKWDELIAPNGKTLHQDLVDKANNNESISPRDVLISEYVESIGVKHMGIQYHQHGWAIASAVYNVAAGYSIRGGTKIQ